MQYQPTVKHRTEGQAWLLRNLGVAASVINQLSTKAAGAIIHDLKEQQQRNEVSPKHTSYLLALGFTPSQVSCFSTATASSIFAVAQISKSFLRSFSNLDLDEDKPDERPF